MKYLFFVYFLSTLFLGTLGFPAPAKEDFILNKESLSCLKEKFPEMGLKNKINIVITLLEIHPNDDQSSLWLSFFNRDLEAHGASLQALEERKKKASPVLQQDRDELLQLQQAKTDTENNLKKTVSSILTGIEDELFAAPPQNSPNL